MKQVRRSILVGLLLLSTTLIFPQNIEYIEITGKVVDPLFKPVAFATIVSKKTGLGTISQQNGDFSIRAIKKAGF